MAKKKPAKKRTYRKIKPTGLSGWQRMGSGSPGRKHVPSHVFYDQARRRYPHKVWRGGKWQESPRMQMAAYRRASQQGDRAIAAKAARDINKRRRKSGQALVGGAKK